jgi:hypothetical protein
VRFPALLSGGGGTAAARGGGEGVGGSRGRVGHRMSRTKRVKVESHSRACLESEDEVGVRIDGTSTPAPRMPLPP